MSLKIGLDELAIPGEGIMYIEGSETEVRIVAFNQYSKIFPEMQEKFPPKSGTIVVVVVRQKVSGVWVQIAHFIGRGSGLHNDILLAGLGVPVP